MRGWDGGAVFNGGIRTGFSNEVTCKGLNEMREQASGVLVLACTSSHEPIVLMSSQLLVEWHLVSGLKSATVGGFTSWKLVNATN